MSKTKIISLVIAAIIVALGFYLAANRYTIHTSQTVWFITQFFGSLFNIILPNPDINQTIWLWFSLGQIVQFFFIYSISRVLLSLVFKKSASAAQ
jgi:hypothetical protein